MDSFYPYNIGNQILLQWMQNKTIHQYGLDSPNYLWNFMMAKYYKK